MSILKVDTINEKTSGNGVAIPGHIIQVVSNKPSFSHVTSNSSSFVEATTAARTTITPKFLDSKILFHCGLGLGAENTSHDAQSNYQLYDVTAGAAVANTESALRTYDYGGSGLYIQVGQHFVVQIDSWGTTAKTFTYYYRLHAGIRVRLGDENKNTYMTIMEIAQ
tara:strand:+ start:558 stop:1055 length:498 start_codon:yes stop_codon:yes gene_type:complete